MKININSVLASFFDDVIVANIIISFMCFSLKAKDIHLHDTTLKGFLLTNDSQRLITYGEEGINIHNIDSGKKKIHPSSRSAVYIHQTNGVEFKISTEKIRI